MAPGSTTSIRVPRRGRQKDDIRRRRACRNFRQFLKTDEVPAYSVCAEAERLFRHCDPRRVGIHESRKVSCVTARSGAAGGFFLCRDLRGVARRRYLRRRFDGHLPRADLPGAAGTHGLRRCRLDAQRQPDPMARHRRRDRCASAGTGTVALTLTVAVAVAVAVADTKSFIGKLRRCLVRRRDICKRGHARHARWPHLPEQMVDPGRQPGAVG